MSYVNKILDKNQVEYDIYAERANKTADGKDIDTAIAEAQTAGDIVELTEETAAEIFNAKPKFIHYDYAYWTLCSAADGIMSYSYIYNGTSKVIDIEEDGESFTITMYAKNLASEEYVDENKGTKLYKHYVGGSTSFYMIDSNSKPLNEEASGYGIQDRINNAVIIKLDDSPIINKSASGSDITFKAVNYNPGPTDTLTIKTLTLTARSFTDTVTPL